MVALPCLRIFFLHLYFLYFCCMLPLKLRLMLLTQDQIFGSWASGWNYLLKILGSMDLLVQFSVNTFLDLILSKSLGILQGLIICINDNSQYWNQHNSLQVLSLVPVLSCIYHTLALNFHLVSCSFPFYPAHQNLYSKKIHTVCKLAFHFAYFLSYQRVQ